MRECERVRDEGRKSGQKIWGPAHSQPAGHHHERGHRHTKEWHMHSYSRTNEFAATRSQGATSPDPRRSNAEREWVAAPKAQSWRSGRVARQTAPHLVEHRTTTDHPFLNFRSFHPLAPPISTSITISLRTIFPSTLYAFSLDRCYSEICLRGA